MSYPVSETRTPYEKLQDDLVKWGTQLSEITRIDEETARIFACIAAFALAASYMPYWETAAVVCVGLVVAKHTHFPIDGFFEADKEIQTTDLKWVIGTVAIGTLFSCWEPFALPGTAFYCGHILGRKILK